MVGSRWTCFCIRVPRTLELSNHKLKSASSCTVWLQCTPVPHRQADGEHHGNSAMKTCLANTLTGCLYSRHQVRREVVLVASFSTWPLHCLLHRCHNWRWAPVAMIHNYSIICCSYNKSLPNIFPATFCNMPWDRQRIMFATSNKPLNHANVWKIYYQNMKFSIWQRLLTCF